MKANTTTSNARDVSARATRNIDAVRSVVGLILAMFLMIGVACTVPAFADEPAEAQAQETPLVPPAVTMTEEPHNGVSTFIGTLESIINSDASKVYAAQAQAQMEAFEEAGGPEAVQAASELQDRSLQAADGSATTQTAEAAAPAALYDVIQVGDAAIPYVDSLMTSTAPTSTAGLWWGSDSTTDGQLGYFIGHNPGVFTCLLSLGQGSAITVWDSDGNAFTYHVIDQFNVPNTTYFEQLQERIGGHGESIALQTCIQGGAYYRIIVAA